MPQAPTWLPYRLRARIDQRRIESAVRAITSATPMPPAEPGDASAEVFVLLCKRDLLIGLVAIRSLLRFFQQDTRLALTVADDGSLNDEDRGLVDRQFPGARWCRWREEPTWLKPTLEKFPRLGELYRKSNYKPIGKLLYPMAGARCERVIVLDPDTAFFEHPQRIARFCGGDDAAPLYMHDHRNEARDVPAACQEVFAKLEHDLTPTGCAWRLAYRFFNSGLLVYRPDRMGLALAEHYLEWRTTMPDSINAGMGDIWFGRWTPEQTCYHVMFALSEEPAQPLGDDYWLGGGDGHVFNHFLRHYLVQTPSLRRLHALVREIAR
ncbi:MAG: hypothetical protein GC164_15335 [Phycisphaera sp.]|nr:hypothetical protein [Phycisphaera sp.]